MVKKKIEIKTNDYSFWIGLWKATKNTLVIFTPALLAFLANVPAKYTPIASIVAYLVKNYLEVKYVKT